MKVKKMIFKASYVLTLMMLLPLMGFSQGLIKLMDRQLEVPRNEASLRQFVSDGQADMVNGRYYRLVTFEAPLQQEWQDKLSNQGFHLLQYIPDLNYIISISSSADASLLLQAGAIHAMPLAPEFKQHPDLLAGMYPEWAMPDNDRLDVWVSFYDDIPVEIIDSYLRLEGWQEIEGYRFDHIRTFRVLRSALTNIASLPYVSWISAIGPQDEPENYTGKTLHRSAMISSSYSTGRKYDGSGVQVMMQDDGIIGPHIDYEGRIPLQTISYNYGDHGDHVAGTIMGAGNLDPRQQGMASGADLYVYGASPTYPGFANMVSHYYLYNIRVSSTSYSNGCNAGYTSLARTMDQQMRQLPSAMHVFSAGNDGFSDCGYGAGPGWGNITGGHKIGKNVIAVANLDYKDDLSGSSSRGPAHDGRIKPDVAGKGSSVSSTTDPNLYTTKSGTSMSCPGVSGTLTQLYHAFRELNAGNDPDGGLMKAVVLNSADDLDTPGPDFKTGWGRINAYRAVKTLEEQRYMTDSLTQGDTNTHTFTIPAQVSQFRVMVYWTDPEAFVGTSKALVNDLDIRGEDALSSLHLPWVLDPSPIPALLNAPATTGVDDLNNVEQIVLNNPLPGTFSLEVIGKLVPQGPQTYYVVYEMLTDTVQLTYPVGGESFEPNESVTVRWDAHGDATPFSLEYSINNGLTWTSVATSIPGGRRYFNWTVPNTHTGMALVRISRGTESSESYESFSIMDIPQNLDVAWACKDSFQLVWDSVPGAESYVVYMLGSKYMDTVGVTLDNHFIISGVHQSETKWVSVSAVGANNARGLRANAIEKVPGIWNCTFPYDLMLEIVSPAPGHHPSCIDHSSVMVKVALSNVGSLAVSNIPVVTTLGGLVQSETFTGTILPGETAYHTFANPLNLSATGTFYVNASVQYPLDSNVYNNLFTSKVMIKNLPAITNGQLETFDAFSACSIVSDCEEVSCSLEGGWNNEANDDLDDIDWRTVQGITPSSGTGPLGDHTKPDGSGNFVYLEASGDCYEREAHMVSPCLDLSGMTYPVLDFWYNMFGNDMGSLHIDVMTASEWILDVMPPITGNQGQAWKKAVLDLSSYTSGKVAVRFRGITGPGNLSDIAIDDIALVDATALNEDPARQLGLHYFPNPAQDVLHLQFNPEGLQSVNVHILDISGRSVIPALSASGSVTSSFDIDLGGLPSGTYIIRVTTDKVVAHEKFQIVR